MGPLPARNIRPGAGRWIFKTWLTAQVRDDYCVVPKRLTVVNHIRIDNARRLSVTIEREEILGLGSRKVLGKGGTISLRQFRTEVSSI